MLDGARCNTYVEVFHVEFIVLNLEVLLCDEDTLTEEVFMDLLAIGLRDEPINCISRPLLVMI